MFVGRLQAKKGLPAVPELGLGTFLEAIVREAGKRHQPRLLEVFDRFVPKNKPPIDRADHQRAIPPECDGVCSRASLFIPVTSPDVALVCRASGSRDLS